MNKPSSLVKARTTRLSPVGTWRGDVYVLPKGRATYDRMVEQMARTTFNEVWEQEHGAPDTSTTSLRETHWAWSRPHQLFKARVALKAIGITRP